MIPIAVTEALYYGQTTIASQMLALVIMVPMLIVLGFGIIMVIRLMRVMKVDVDVREKTE